MVPLVVAVVARDVDLHAIGTVKELGAFKADEELILGSNVVGMARAVANECAAALCVGLEPEHERIVFLFGEIQSFLAES